jgi:hypothetical protein
MPHAELWQPTYVMHSRQEKRGGIELSARPSRRRGMTLEAAMNWSMYTADRTTHLKIVVVGLAAAVLIAVIGISAREFNLGTDIMTAQNPTVIKAGGPVVLTDGNGPQIR